MTAWEAVVLGIVQGATEFLPVSSSGHLVVAQALLGLRLPGVAFEVAVHLATLVSIAVVYRERIAALVAGVLRRTPDHLREAGLLIVATIPAALIGVGFGDGIEALFDAPEVAGVCFLVTAGLLWSTRRALAKDPEGKVDTVRLALLIGAAQAFAILPGISRSGTTVVVALWLGVAGREAAAFSFLMAIPAIAGAAVLQLPELSGGAGVGSTALLLGGVAAALSGIVAIASFLALLRRQRFHLFSLYLVPLGIAFLAWLRAGGGAG